jgi:hypothetical protein
LRYFGGAVAFGFAAVWIMQSLAAALVCLSAAAAGYGAVLLAERAQRKLGRSVNGSRNPSPSTSSSPSKTGAAEDLSRQADALNDDLGHVYEPASTTTHPSGDAEPDESRLSDA